MWSIGDGGYVEGKHEPWPLYKTRGQPPETVNKFSLTDMKCEIVKRLLGRPSRG
jgi:hypothetical protein